MRSHGLCPRTPDPVQPHVAQNPSLMGLLTRRATARRAKTVKVELGRCYLMISRCSCRGRREGRPEGNGN
ncbi:hypothetical protein PIB30_070155 [Stylosanthes scabra]|uniref:Uncharacterized protein n=1 Tax=Stylosanthes scabra TaxID=79078 RepID=A0ABU6QNZ9_9FABA|nr:hypothetical protein [Stylosanthes scabra]